MNRISPVELTRDIAGSAAAQMAEYDYAEKMKNCGVSSNIAVIVPRGVAEKIAKGISAAVYVEIDLSYASDMAAIRHVLKNENN